MEPAWSVDGKRLVYHTNDAGESMYVADGTNNKVWILERSTGKTLGSFGSNGRYAGMFRLIDAIAMDSKGNIYTGEVSDGKRIQRFVPVLAGGR
jgi:sugar lactone lactonase YvrE